LGGDVPGRTDDALVGRKALLADLTGWLGSAGAGRGRSVLLQGEPGVGKSSLAEAVAGRLSQEGFRVARGWCSAAGMPPYWPWRRALAPLAATVSFEVAEAGRDERAGLFAAVVDALDLASQERPLLILIEDLHWADEPSLLLLRTVVDAVPAHAVALLLTTRDDPLETPEPVREALRELPTSLRRVAVPLLDPDAATQLVRLVAGEGMDDATVRDVVGHTGGNPFFVTEVARLLAATGSAARPGAGRGFVVPPGVREALRRRLARLSQPCHALLVAAAVVGQTAVTGRDRVDEPLLSAVSGADPAQVATLLDEAVRARVLVEDATGIGRLHLGFAHALVREVLIADLSPVERGRLHRRAAPVAGGACWGAGGRAPGLPLDLRRGS
jgi:predicted ATPase